jgi:hypothetical protein
MKVNHHAVTLMNTDSKCTCTCNFSAAPSVTSQIGHSAQDHAVAKYCLLLPGKVLHISALLIAKRFRDKGNKDGAVRAIRTLESAGLGEVIEVKPQRGTNVVSTYCVL